MVLDPDDPDTFSAGSFFTNPIVAASEVPDGAPAFDQDLLDGSIQDDAPAAALEVRAERVDDGRATPLDVAELLAPG